MNTGSSQGFLSDLEKKIEDGSASNQWICDQLKIQFPGFDWVGIYLLEGERLLLDSYSGEKTEHEVIALGDGLCSLAIVRDQVVNEPDVKNNKTYLACFPSTNSEIVVPIRLKGKAVGEIDIDSDRKNAFSKEDEMFLSKVAELTSELIARKA